MKKLVIKTAVITFIAIIVLFFLCYGLLCAFSPSLIAKAWDGVGNYSVSVKYYEKQYLKTDDINDLFELCDKVDEINDGERAELYLGDLVGRTDFISECNKRDEGKSGFSSVKVYEGKYVTTLFYIGGKSLAESGMKTLTEKEFLSDLLNSLMN